MNQVQVMAPSFGVINARAPCPDCAQATPVSALVVFDFKMRRDRDAEWVDHPVSGLISHIGRINSGAKRIWHALAPSIRAAGFTTGGSFYYTNSCAHCNQPIGDVPLRQPGKVFQPADAKAEIALSLHWIEAVLLVDARVRFEHWADGFVARHHPWA